MNYLAHAYLSFEDPEILTGNMVSDFVKGRRKFDYPPRVVAGIELHRTIDEFTDQHETTRQAAMLFKPAYGLYYLAFMDVSYDHFLATELAGRGNHFLEKFVASTYDKLDLNESLMPDGFRRLFPYMKQENWLLNYQYLWGIEKSFGGLVHRARYITDSKPAMEIFEKNYQRFQDAYNDFFPELLGFSLEKFADIH